jgi:hypothetical protein
VQERIEEEMTTAPADTSFRFDDRAITWRPFRGPAGLSFWVLHVDDAKQHVNILFRLDPFARCVPHNHVGPTSTLVIEGEHRTYQNVDGEWTIHEIRPPGTFAAHDGDSAHVEEGGPNGATILLSMTAVNGVIWTLLDDDGNVTEKTTVIDFARALQKQNS